MALTSGKMRKAVGASPQPGRARAEGESRLTVGRTADRRATRGRAGGGAPRLRCAHTPGRTVPAAQMPPKSFVRSRWRGAPAQCNTPKKNGNVTSPQRIASMNAFSSSSSPRLSMFGHLIPVLKAD